MVSQRAVADRDAFTAGRDLHLTLLASDKQNELLTVIADQHTRQYSYSRERPVFMQYLNPEILSCYGLRHSDSSSETELEEALHATRLAILATDQYLVFPASYFLEAPQLPSLLKRVESLVWSGDIRYVSYTTDISSYFDQKAEEYRADAQNPYRLARAVQTSGIALVPRLSNSTASDIAIEWRDALSAGGFLAPIIRSMQERWPKKRDGLEDSLAAVPERLEGQAFIGRFVRHTLPIQFRGDESLRVDLFVSRAYLASYLLDLDAMILARFPRGDLSCGVGQLGEQMRGRVLSAQRLDLALRWLGLWEFIHCHGTWSDLIALRSTPEFGAVAVAALHLCPSAPFRRVATRARRTLKYQDAASLSDAHSIVAVASEEIEKTNHFTF